MPSPKPIAEDQRIRCSWCTPDPIYIAYHDEEWGVPLHDDQKLFELLCLEGAQAGLSWLTILRKREHYRKVYKNFDAAAIARFTKAKQEKLLLDAGIVRNQLKVNAFVANARAYLKIKDEWPSFDSYVWSFVDYKTTVNRVDQAIVSTPISEAMSKDLKKRGFKFVGSTICYAFMQAAGLVDDHARTCWRSEV